MTREEAIEILQRKTTIPNDSESFDYICEAYNMAIKALEQEPILDKIRAEIEFEVDHRTNMLCAEDVFAILDKYKAESEGII